MRKAISFVIVALASALASADVPATINYVGHLEGVTSTGDGKTLENRAMYMALRLYAKPGTGDPGEKADALWGRQATVAMTDGDFDVELSDSLGTALPGLESASLASAVQQAISDGSTTVYIGLTPADDANAEIFPRQPVNAVIRAMQAQDVRTVPDGFRIAQELQTSETLHVTGNTELGGAVVYEKAEFAGPPPEFTHGLKIDETLSVGSLTNVGSAVVGTAKARTITAGTVSAASAEVSGSVEWSAALSVSTAEVAKVSAAGGMTAKNVSVQTLSVDTFAFPAGAGLRREHWSPLGDWTKVKSFSQGAHSGASIGEVFDFCCSRTKVTRNVNAVYSGSWTAPVDCVAYFQTYVHDETSADGATLQFYVVQDVGELVDKRMPNGVASCEGAGRTLRSVVPIVLRKGECVKWVGYNQNKAQGGTLVQCDDTRVDGIVYRAFNW